MSVQAHLCMDNSGFSLGGSQNWMESAYGFNLPMKQQQQQQQLQNLLQKTENHNNHEELAFSRSIAAQMEKQRQEVDRFICLQNERLRWALHQQRKQQLSLLLRKCEAKAVVILKQKDEEIAKSMKRTGELQDFMRKIQIENQNWQRLAKENAAMVESLNNTIDRFKENACFSILAEDAESCCDVMINRGERAEETGENMGQEHGEQRTTKMVCKSCNSRNSCVIFLPCRHLCSCKSCHAFLESCPVCGVVKKAIIEALI